MQVVHIGDISGTSRNVIAVAQQKGMDWRLRPVPTGRGQSPMLILWRRLRDLVEVRCNRPKPDLLHINYGVSGYYGWFRQGVVLHLHGTDVRQDLQSKFLGPVVRHSIKTADVVLYSTPDMAAALLQIRPDATWFPAPLPLAAEVLLTPTQPRNGRRIFFASRWDDTKGAPELLDLVREIRRSRPTVEMQGLDWGKHRHEAAALGVQLLPHMSEPAFRQQLADADIVVGQVRFGVLGLSDLEAMAQARPLVASYTVKDAYGSDAPIANSATAAPIDLVLGLLDDPERAEALGKSGRLWALRYHSASVLQQRLSDIYAGLLRLR